ncbi:hypothetical protein HDV00_002567 [Rhizophlyctis rosea]|nr:hypothetical protein HDV00_002567 [Rhizophlyctis rosea]
MREKVPSPNEVQAHSAPITSIDAKYGIVVTGSKDTTLQLRHLPTLKPLASLTHTGMSSISALNFNGRSALACGDTSGVLRFWELDVVRCGGAGARLKWIGMRHAGPVIGIVMNETILCSMALDPTLLIWSTRTGTLTQRITTSPIPVNPLRMHLLNSTLLIGYANGLLATHSLSTPKTAQTWRAHEGPVACCQIVGGCGDVVVSGQESGVVKVWCEGKCVREVEFGESLVGCWGRWVGGEGKGVVEVEMVGTLSTWKERVVI